MTSIEKSIFPQVLIIIAGCLLILLLIHPKMSRLISPFNKPVSFDQNSAATRLWQFNEQYYFGYRLPPTENIPDGPWLGDYPTLKGKTFAQVSILQSKRNYSVDLVLDSSVSAQKLVTTLKAENPHAYIYLYSPEEALTANGYYFENKALRNKYWVNISRYQL